MTNNELGNEYLFTFKINFSFITFKYTKYLVKRNLKEKEINLRTSIRKKQITYFYKRDCKLFTKCTHRFKYNL